MKSKIIIIILLITLTACSSAQPSADVANTAIAIVQTGVALTQTAVPTPTPTFMPTATVVYPTPSPLPTEPIIPMITPDAIQVERWQEIEKELAKNILPMDSIESVICEWEILGSSEKKVYVLAVCASLSVDDSFPAVIHFKADGSVHNVEIPRRASEWSSDINKMFPAEIQAKFKLYVYSEIYTEMLNHLRYRLYHPEEPPLVILSATPTATPTP